MRRHRHNKTLVQAVLLSKATHSRKDAELDAHRFGALKMESARNWWRLRLRQPRPLERQGYRFRIKAVKPGVRLVVAAKGRRPNPAAKRYDSKKYLAGGSV